jgi:2-polyprenyl-3-methyl-5-hydroxy-6-metoxy-1,4-benzoquinol methylase
MKNKIRSFRSFSLYKESAFSGYKKFEDDIINSRKEVIDNIKDICIDLVDDGLCRIGFNDVYRNDQFLFIRTAIADKPIYLENFKEYILRVIDYLGDSFVQIRYSKHPSYRLEHEKDQTYYDIKIDNFLKDDFNIKEGLWSVVIKYNVGQGSNIELNEECMKYIRSYRLYESVLLDLDENVDDNLISIIESLVDSGSKILEISCGNGSDSIKLSNLGYEVVATDLDKNYVDFVNSKGIECIQHDTRKRFPFDEDEFDLIYSRLGLHYFNEPELDNIFKELNRLTSGYLVFTVKLVNDIQTGKVILSEDIWEDLVSKYFDIISFEIKEGILYNNKSKWLEIVAKKKD